jgi:hypothetical protein
MKAFLLLVPFALFATSYTINQNGNWHTATTFTPNGTPDFGDTINNDQYKLTCETGQTCNLGMVNTTSLTVGDGTHPASLVVNGTLTLRGQGGLNGAPADCSNGPTVTLGTGSTLNLDENGGSVASGFVIGSGTIPCVRFNIGTVGDQCTWGTSTPVCPTNVNSINNGSTNGVLLLDNSNGTGTTIMNWFGFAINNCGSSSTSVGCFIGDFYSTSGGTGAWNWTQGYLNASGFFRSSVAGGMASAVPVALDSVISQGRLSGADILLNTQCSSGAYSGGVLVTPACSVTRSITRSLLRMMRPDGPSGGDESSMGMTVSDVFWDGLGVGYPALAAANIAGGSWSYVVAVTDSATCTQDRPAYLAALAPTVDHVYSICPSVASSGNPNMLEVPSNNTWGTNVNVSNVIFDNPTTTAGNAGHCFQFGNNGMVDSGYSVNLSYITVLTNSLGTGGCEFTAWSGLCHLGPAISITHSLQPATGTEGQIYFCEGNTSVASAPLLSAFKGNIYSDTLAAITARGTALNPLAFGNFNAANQPANVVPPTGADYNASFNFLPFVTTSYTTACVPGCTNSGSPYAVPMTGSAPGVHDQNVNPQVSNSRNAYTWAATHGQMATYAGFRQVFINGGPSAIGANIAALFYYINRGNIPGRSLWNAMPDGTTIGPSQPVMFPGNIRTVTQ